MPLSIFLKSLYATGVVEVSRPDSAGLEDGEVANLLTEIDRDRRWEMPGRMPLLDMDSARWAAATLYRAGQFFVYRDVPADQISSALAESCPKKPSPSVCYSVDLTFAALPDLISLARGLSAEDPLTLGLLKLAAAWPLSSVGVANVADVDIEPFMTDPAVARLYVDRIIQRRDVARLKHPEVCRLAKLAVGPFRELAPLVAAELGEDRGSA